MAPRFNTGMALLKLPSPVPVKRRDDRNLTTPNPASGIRPEANEKKIRLSLGGDAVGVRGADSYGFDSAAFFFTEFLREASAVERICQCGRQVWRWDGGEDCAHQGNNGSESI